MNAKTEMSSRNESGDRNVEKEAEQQEAERPDLCEDLQEQAVLLSLYKSFQQSFAIAEGR